MEYVLRLTGAALLCASSMALASGCGNGDKPPPPCLVPPCDGIPDCPGEPYSPPPSDADTDGDGTPDSRDTDADGDGIPNDVEHLGGNMCLGPDPDMDGIDSWLDTDSDNDGIPDRAEGEEEPNSDPFAVDSDGDGTTDLIERAAGTDPLDPESMPRSGSTALELPYMGGDVEATVRIQNIIENADVFILLDTTASMMEERDGLKEGIEMRIIPDLLTQFNDVQIGIGQVADYPFSPYGCSGGDCRPPDTPFNQVIPVVPVNEDLRSSNVITGINCPTFVGALEPGGNGIIDVVEAIRATNCNHGEDFPEAFTSALWAIATGGSLTWTGGQVPEQRDCPAGTFGYPCFRTDALPVVLMIGDAAFHNGPRPEFDYGFGEAPTWTETTMELATAGIRVVSIFTGDMMEDRGDYEELAMATGAVGREGPLVFQLSPTAPDIDMTVVSAMTDLASGLNQDVTARADNEPGNPVDATSLVMGMRTGEGYGTDGLAGADPRLSYATKDATTFYGMVGGASGDFIFTLRNDNVMPTARAQVLTLAIRGIGDSGTSFATRYLYLVIADGPVVL